MGSEVGFGQCYVYQLNFNRLIGAKFKNIEKDVNLKTYFSPPIVTVNKKLIFVFFIFFCHPNNLNITKNLTESGLDFLIFSPKSDGIMRLTFVTRCYKVNFFP